MATSSPDLQAAYQAQVAAVRTQVLAFLVALWRSLGSWRSPDRFVSTAIPVVVGAEQHIAALTTAYLSQLLAGHLGRTQTPLPTPRDVSGPVLRGVDLAEEYARPFHDVWRALGDGEPLQDALAAGEQRLQSLASTDLQLAKTHTARAVLVAEPDVVGYRRVLEGERSCGLCVVASTHRYHKQNLLPIHPGCDCSVAPVVGDWPDLAVDNVTLEAAHRAVADRFGDSSPAAREIPGALQDGKPTLYRDVLIVHHHGEIGPVLAVRGQAFTGPSDI